MWMDEAACLKTCLIFGHLLIPNSGLQIGCEVALVKDKGGDGHCLRMKQRAEQKKGL